MSPEPAVRQRAKHTRSRLGCGVCRIRRVRCDQTKPACLRCSSTGRKCDGYTQLVVQSTPKNYRDLSIVPPTCFKWQPSLRSPPPSIPNWTHVEGSSFDFFRCKTSIELAGPIQDEFWTQLVLQVSHREECVRYMVFALSFLHQSTSSQTSATFADQAARYYARSLRSLNHHIISNEGAALDVTLLCSLLCVNFEWLRGNNQGAEVHLKAGMKLLEQWHVAARSRGASPRTSFWSPSGHLIRSILSPAYTRLYLQAQALLQDHGLPLPPPEETSALEDGQPFSSFHEARDKLYEILCDAYSFKRILEEEKRKTKGRKATQPPKRRLPPIQAVAQWSVNLDKMFETQPHLKEKTGALALRIWLNTITIMVGMKDSDDETGFDRFTPAFTNIVDLTERFYQRQVSLFCADISIVSILYFVGVKCRYPLVRRRAIALLSTTQRREGVWDSKGAAKISREVLEIEENRVQDKVSVETDLKREARVKDITVVLDDEDHTWTLQPRG